MAIRLQDKLNTDAPDGRYIYGNIRNDNGSGNGTALNVINHSDFHQFFSRMMDVAGVPFNGYSDDDYNGFQLFEALQEIVTSFKNVMPYAVSALLTDSNFGMLNVMIVNGDTTFTLPPASSANQSKKIKIIKIGTGKLTIIPSGADSITPMATVIVRDKGWIELCSDSGNQYIITDHNIDDELLQIGTSNGTGIDVNIVGSGPFATSSETYFYSLIRKNGFTEIHFKGVIVVSDGAIVDEIRFPLPNGVVKDTSITEDYALKGSCTFKAPGSTTNYLSLLTMSNGSGAEGQRIVIRRVQDGDTDIQWSTGVTTTIEGMITIKDNY